MRAIVDAGPLVALFDRRESHHRWVAERLDELDAPLLVCEPVLTETLHLSLRRSRTAFSVLMDFLERGALRLAFRIENEVPALRRLLAKYADRPISLADACIVRMAELNDDHAVLTLDSDFANYRKHGRSRLPLIHPTLA